MKVVADIKSVSYYENRALECIQSAQHELCDKNDMLGKAITLLTLSIHQRMAESKGQLNCEPNTMGI